MANASLRASAASVRRWQRSPLPVSAWCVPASGSTPTFAPATIPASACRGVRRSPSSPTRIHCAPTRLPTSITTASAVGCAARSRTRPSFARPLPRSTWWRTHQDGIACVITCRGLSSAGWAAGARKRRRSCRRSKRLTAARPIKLLIAALGGEGGGVLSAWIHSAAIASGHFVQGTYIPGVAQRTGATTYYLELVPGAGERHRVLESRPVLALNAAPGEVDLVVASELLESTRAIGAGYVTPDRTVLIASLARVFTIDEKAAMGDGRLDEARMRAMAERFSRRAIVADFARLAVAAQGQLNAVLLGAVAASA